MPLRIHVIGASGSGTSTLGRALSARFSLPFTDSDDIFWENTDPPFTTKNAAREADLAAALPGEDWIFSGSSMGWGDFLRGRFTHVIFLSLPPGKRIERLKAREKERYGARIAMGGDLHSLHQDFLTWAAGYDQGSFEGRSLLLHEKWLRELPCPVLRLDGALATQEQVARFEKSLTPLLFSIVRAANAGPLVDPLYERLGRTARARPGDVFFVAAGQGGETFGCVRYCVEESTPMLRSMLVAEHARKRGVGTALLEELNAYLIETNVRGVYCVPFEHLESFYASIGFRRSESGPPFLLARVEEYRKAGQSVLLMLRP